MKYILLFVIAGILLMKCQSTPQADAVFINGKIYTLNDESPGAEAVAVKDGLVLRAGTTYEIKKLIGNGTVVYDLKGYTMTPGFIEGHGHFMPMGYGLMHLDLSQVKSYEQLLDSVSAAVKKASSGEWIQGRGWHQDKWDSISGKVVKGFPTNKPLNDISPDNPVILRHASGHAVLVNANALKLAGINSQSVYRERGEIIKDGEGNPTGILNEGAAELVNRVVPDNDFVSNEKAFHLAVENCLENGITSFHDAGTDGETIGLYRKMLQQGQLKVRLYVMLDGSDDSLLDQYFRQGPVIGEGNGFLTIRSVKLFADGALGSRGAWLLEPYSDRPGHYGFAVTSMDRIYEVARKAYSAGFQVCTHAIGDRANREVLDQYEKVFGGSRDSVGLRFRIEHAQHLSKQDIPRFAELGVIPSMQAIHLSSDRPWAIERLGMERIEEGAYVWQKLLKTGVRIVNGTDVPVEPISPLHCFYAAITRKTLEGQPPGGYEPSQRMTRLQALKSYTINPAYGAFEENMKGSIIPGKLADFTVFSNDIMTIPADKILDTKVVMTVIGGKVYENGRPNG